MRIKGGWDVGVNVPFWAVPFPLLFGERSIDKTDRVSDASNEVRIGVFDPFDREDPPLTD